MAECGVGRVDASVYRIITITAEMQSYHRCRHISESRSHFRPSPRRSTDLWSNSGLEIVKDGPNVLDDYIGELRM